MPVSKHAELIRWMGFVPVCVVTLLCVSSRPSRGDELCNQMRVPVRLTADGPQDFEVAAWLCGDAPLSEKTAHVVVSGTTYNRFYWDFPYEPERYSYVRALTDAGYAVLNYDRIGVGESDLPPALEATVDANALVLHQLIQGLREGRIGPEFDKVVTVGHSQGSAIVTHEAARFDDVDGIILTGLYRTPIGPSAPLLFTSLHPAQTDPKFEDENVPFGYLTTRPGTRGRIFYHEPNTDDQVITVDEATKDLFPTGEGTAVPTLIESVEIDVPVLSVMGEFDGFFCPSSCAGETSLRALEPLFWSEETCFEVFVLPEAGHNVNLHRNAGQWYEAAADWTHRRIGATADAEPSGPCRAEP